MDPNFKVRCIDVGLQPAKTRFHDGYRLLQHCMIFSAVEQLEATLQMYSAAHSTVLALYNAKSGPNLPHASLVEFTALVIAW